MLPIILNIQDKKENVDLSKPAIDGWKYVYHDKAHIYVALPTQHIADRAHAWLQGFSFMQKSCEIIDYKHTQIMHFKPVHTKQYFASQDGEVNVTGAAFNAGEPPIYTNQERVFSIYSSTQGGTSRAFVKLVQILDETVPQHIDNFQDWNYAHTTNFWLEPTSCRDYDQMLFKFNPQTFPIHVTDDLPSLFDQILAPVMPQTIPVSQYDAALAHIKKLEAELKKHKAVEKTQDKLLSQQAEAIKVLTKTIAEQNDAYQALSDLHADCAIAAYDPDVHAAGADGAFLLAFDDQ